MSYHVDYPRRMNARAFTRRALNAQSRPLRKPMGILGAPATPRRQRVSKKRTERRELITVARTLTGRERMGWKATKKLMRRLDRRARS